MEENVSLSEKKARKKETKKIFSSFAEKKDKNFKLSNNLQLSIKT
jgi:hypothetical protein